MKSGNGSGGKISESICEKIGDTERFIYRLQDAEAFAIIAQRDAEISALLACLQAHEDAVKVLDEALRHARDGFFGDECFENHLDAVAAARAQAAELLSGNTKCAHCGKPMQDKGAETQWCGSACYEAWKAAELLKRGGE